MSYILNALRKSEAQRRLGQRPDLHTASLAPSRKPVRHKGLRFAAALVVVLVAAAAGVWFWQADDDGPVQEQLADGREAPALEADRTEPTAAIEPPSEQLAEAGAEESAAAATPVSDRRSPPQPPATVVSRPAPRRPGESAIPSGERERLVTSAEEAQRLIEAQMAEAAQASPSEPPPTVRTPSPPAAAAPPDPAPTQAAEDQVAAWSPERMDVLRAWELPLSVRRELPSLSLSIHVFSSEPAARFVLINGERRVEGEDLGQGASLAEIRRDGAIIDFRDYRFLLEP